MALYIAYLGLAIAFVFFGLSIVFAFVVIRDAWRTRRERKAVKSGNKYDAHTHAIASAAGRRRQSGYVPSGNLDNV